MTLRSAILVLLAMTLVVSASQGEWTMRIHKDGSIEEIPVAEIDSLTFFDSQLVRIPAGTFIQGDGVATCGQDEREVTLTRDFHLAKHEVTNQEYVLALQWAYDNGYVGASVNSAWDLLHGSMEELIDLDDPENHCEIEFDGAGIFNVIPSSSTHATNAYPGGYDPSDHPVKEVTWFGAARYCDWLSLQAGLPRAYEHNGDWLCGPDPDTHDPYAAVGYRLPTGAEREYASQYDDERIYPWGNEDPNCDLVNYNHVCIGWTTPVGSYPDAPETLQGLSGMGGNVWEWCNDWRICNLGTNPVTDPAGPIEPSVEGRMAMGGNWHAPGVRNAKRGNGGPEGSHDLGGFRVARTINP